MRVLYEDNHLLAVFKPAGMLTQPDETGRPNLEEEAKEYIRTKYQKSGNVFLHAVHRLDLPVSGIVIFARTSKALSRLNESQRAGTWVKVYRAWVEQAPELLEATVCHFLLREEQGTKLFEQSVPGSKESKLHYRVLEKTEQGALLEITLLTGRHHQIRLQLSALGCPIVGDKKYGAKKQSEQIELCHSEVTFPHPVTHEVLKIKSTS